MLNVLLKSALFLIFLLPISGHGEVLSASHDGFISQNTLTINAQPKQVYRAITQQIEQWWDAAHTYSGSSKNLYIEAKPMGCFCEKIDGKPAVLHMTVINLQKNKLIRMQGGLGPLQNMGVDGALSWMINPVDAGSELKLRYQVSGYHPEGLSSIAKAVDNVLLQQAKRLKDYLEEKSP